MNLSHSCTEVSGRPVRWGETTSTVMCPPAPPWLPVTSEARALGAGGLAGGMAGPLEPLQRRVGRFLPQCLFISKPTEPPHCLEVDRPGLAGTAGPRPGVLGVAWGMATGTAESVQDSGGGMCCWLTSQSCFQNRWCFRVRGEAPSSMNIPDMPVNWVMPPKCTCAQYTVTLSGNKLRQLKCHRNGRGLELLCWKCLR